MYIVGAMRYGYSVRVTNQRKHRVQMNETEAATVMTYLRSVSAWDGYGDVHVTERQDARRVSNAEIAAAIKHGTLVEVHVNNHPDVRAVVRYDLKGRSVCVVVSLCQRRVVTTWVNATTDNHSTLRREEYQWNVNLVSYFQQRFAQA